MNEYPARDAVPEPDDLPAAEQPATGWEVLETPPEPWPTLGPVPEAAPPVRTPAEVAAAPSTTPPVSYRLQGRAAVFEAVWRLARTVAHEVGGGRRPEPPALVSGGAMQATGILVGLFAVMLLFVAMAVGSAAGMAIMGVLLAGCVALVALGHARDTRPGRLP